MDGESGSRILHSVNDLIELLRLAQGATDRLEHDVHGVSYEHADMIARDIHRLRRQAEKLKVECERMVSREESATVSRGHPLRRAQDRVFVHRPASPQKPS
jgi:signal transduction histidine kinase